MILITRGGIDMHEAAVRGHIDIIPRVYHTVHSLMWSAIIINSVPSYTVNTCDQPTASDFNVYDVTRMLMTSYLPWTPHGRTPPPRLRSSVNQVLENLRPSTCKMNHRKHKKTTATDPKRFFLLQIWFLWSLYMVEVIEQKWNEFQVLECKCAHFCSPKYHLIFCTDTTCGDGKTSY